MRLRNVLLAATALVLSTAARADLVTYAINGALLSNSSITVTGTASIYVGNTGNPGNQTGFQSITLNFSNGTTQSGIGTSGQDHSHNVYVGLANDLFSLSSDEHNMSASTGSSFNLTDTSGLYVGNVFSGTMTVINPTPEPSSIALLGTGLVGVAGVLRRRFV